jgi:hypothetical protein
VFGSLVFAVGQPGVMAGLLPYWLTGGWQGSGAPLVLQIAGAVLLAGGVGPGVGGRVRRRGGRRSARSYSVGW